VGRVSDALEKHVAALGSLLGVGDERRVVSILAARLLSHLSTENGRTAHVAV